MTRWREQLIGVVPIISVQTLTEVLAGLRENDVGPRREGEILAQLRRTHSHPIDEALADTQATLKAQLKKAGHALHAKIHTGDRWIAATAVHLGIPLLSNDGIYRDVPRLRLLDSEGPA